MHFLSGFPLVSLNSVLGPHALVFILFPDRVLNNQRVSRVSSSRSSRRGRAHLRRDISIWFIEVLSTAERFSDVLKGADPIDAGSEGSCGGSDET